MTVKFHHPCQSDVMLASKSWLIECLLVGDEGINTKYKTVSEDVLHGNGQ